jgi:hypothetical protein
MNPKLEIKTHLTKGFQVARKVNEAEITLDLVLAANEDLVLVASRNKYIGGFCVLLKYRTQSFNLAGWTQRERKPTVAGIVAIAESYIKDVMFKYPLNGKMLA